MNGVWWRTVLGMFLVWGAVEEDAVAQWVRQSIPLRAGWNAIHLRVTPDPASCDEQFAALPQVQSVWRFNRRLSSVEFVESPGVLLTKTEHWLVWLPRSDPDFFVRTLHRLEGGQAYLVRVADQAPEFAWSVVGVPAWKEPEILPDAPNLMGLPVRPDAPPTFLQFFADTPAIQAGPGAGSGIYRIGADGREEQIRQTARATVQPGVAYWVQCGAFVRNRVPLEIRGEVTAAGVLDFGDDQRELGLVFRNLSGTAQLRVRLVPRASEAAPPGSAEVAGEVPLAYLEANRAIQRFDWLPLTPAGLEFALEPSEEREIRLAVRRGVLPPYEPRGSQGAAYQSLLVVEEPGHGFLALVPVVAEWGTAVRRVAGLSALATSAGELPAQSASQGLWVGQVTVKRVSRSSVAPVPEPKEVPDKDAPEEPPPPPVDPLATVPVASPLSYRLLVHVDAEDRCRLLQRVLLAKLPADPDQPVRLYQDEDRVPAGATLVSRISSVAFPLMQAQPLAGRFARSLAAEVVLDYDDPVNPFKHAFHPDHDNLDEAYTTNRLPAGVESFTVTRDVWFDFQVTQQTSDGRYLPPGPVLQFSGNRPQLALDALTFGGAFTLEAWVRVEGPVTERRTIFYLGAGPSNEVVSLDLEGVNGRMVFTVARQGRESSLVTERSFPTNEWVHVAAVNDGIGTAWIAWNAEEVARGQQDPAAEGTRTRNWCGRADGEPWAHFRGRMYDLTIWDDARSPAGVYEDMHLFEGIIPGRLVAFFPANEGVGTALADASGNGHQATLQGVTWDSTDLPPIPFWGLGRAAGVYREVIYGLRPHPIVLEGPFQLERLNRDPILY